MAEKAKYKDSDEKELWKKIVTVEFISSEESSGRRDKKFWFPSLCCGRVKK